MLDNGKGLDAVALLNWAKDGKSHSAKTVRCRRQERVRGGHGLMKLSPQLSLLGGWPAHLMAGLISSPDGRAHQLT